MTDFEKIRHCLFETRQRMLLLVRELYAVVFGGEKCLSCGAPSGVVPICRSCREKYLFSFIPPVSSGGKRCSVCGKVLVSEREKCMDCRNGSILVHTDEVFPLYQYRLWRKNLLFVWKMENKRALSPVFAKALYDALCALCGAEQPVVVPVPPRPGKIKVRGWDQIDDVCMFLKYRYGVTVLPLLQRTTIQQQKKLDRGQRLEMKGRSYVLRRHTAAWRGEHPLPGKVVLLDDVLTTGVTIESCAALLKEAGIAKVAVLALFIVD